LVSQLSGLGQVPLPSYTVYDLGAFGTGTNSYGFGINNAGWVAGSSNLVSKGPQHSFIWYGSHTLKDLGTLGGASCPTCNSGAGGPNASGEAAIGSDTSTLDPLGQDYCAFGSHRQCLGAVWKNGTLTALSTLPGGHNANAFGLNNRGEVVGFSENGIHDTSCATGSASQVTRFEAVTWGPNGKIRELPPLVDMGDNVAFALGINDSGQVVGSSGLCSTQGLPPNVNGLLAPSKEPLVHVGVRSIWAPGLSSSSVQSDPVAKSARANRMGGRKPETRFLLRFGSAAL
jgi:probable HAF family extracellular repeat protein